MSDYPVLDWQPTCFDEETPDPWFSRAKCGPWRLATGREGWEVEWAGAYLPAREGDPAATPVLTQLTAEAALWKIGEEILRARTPARKYVRLSVLGEDEGKGEEAPRPPPDDAREKARERRTAAANAAKELLRILKEGGSTPHAPEDSGRPTPTCDTCRWRSECASHGPPGALAGNETCWGYVPVGGDTPFAGPSRTAKQDKISTEFLSALRCSGAHREARKHTVLPEDIEEYFGAAEPRLLDPSRGSARGCGPGCPAHGLLGGVEEDEG